MVCDQHKLTTQQVVTKTFLTKTSVFCCISPLECSCCTRNPQGCLPYRSSNRENPLDACGTSQTENMRWDSNWSQSWSSLATFFFLNHSASNPSICGWYMEVLTCFRFSRQHRSFIFLSMKGVPWSIRIYLGIPTQFCSYSYFTVVWLLDTWCHNQELQEYTGGPSRTLLVATVIWSNRMSMIGNDINKFFSDPLMALRTCAAFTTPGQWKLAYSQFPTCCFGHVAGWGCPTEQSQTGLSRGQNQGLSMDSPLAGSFREGAKGVFIVNLFLGLMVLISKCCSHAWGFIPWPFSCSSSHVVYSSLYKPEIHVHPKPYAIKWQFPSAEFFRRPKCCCWGFQGVSSVNQIEVWDPPETPTFHPLVGDCRLYETD